MVLSPRSEPCVPRKEILAVLALGLCPFSGCGSDSSAGDAPPSGPSFFAARALHGDHDHLAGDPDYFMPESMAPGCALFDFDRDGLLDVYHVRGVRSGAEGDGRNRLYRRSPAGRFEDVAEAFGVADDGFGMGVAVGDIDNDGDLDLFVSNYGPDRLYRNDGERFHDIGAVAGVDDPGWSASAGFCDLDGDGFLDLYVTRYLALDPDELGRDSAGRPEYPSPAMFAGLSDRLYRNDGDGTFSDVSEASGISSRSGKGLGVLFTDLDGDGIVDIYVANDGEPNHAWIHDGRFTFTDRASAMGLSVNAMGQPEAGMGVACGDVDGDGDDDIFVTHLVQESSTLYLRQGPGRFGDGTSRAGLGAATIDSTGFGTALLDVELDGDLDLLSANGSVLRRPAHPGVDVPPRWAPYAEPNLMFLNDGEGHFTRGAAAEDGFSGIVEVSRGLATGDLDDDGDIDVVVTTANGTCWLCENRAPRQGRWISVRAVDPALNRDAYGARITVRAGDRSWQRDVNPARGYLSSSDPRVHFGLGPVERVDAIHVRWPGGDEEMFQGGAVDRTVTVNRGEGTPGR